MYFEVICLLVKVGEPLKVQGRQSASNRLQGKGTFHYSGRHSLTWAERQHPNVTAHLTGGSDGRICVAGAKSEVIARARGVSHITERLHPVVEEQTTIRARTRNSRWAWSFRCWRWDTCQSLWHGVTTKALTASPWTSNQQARVTLNGSSSDCQLRCAATRKLLDTLAYLGYVFMNERKL